MSNMKTITEYEIIDHGVDHSQYFQGCGVSHTSFDECFTGIGDNPQEALEDALDSAAQCGWQTESVVNGLSEESRIERPEDEDETSEVYHFVSVRVKGDPAHRVLSEGVRLVRQLLWGARGPGEWSSAQVEDGIHKLVAWADEAERVMEGDQ